MFRIALLLLVSTLIGACSPSYEAEYNAALQELEATKQQLATLQQKLNSADHETRSKIYSLVRRASTHLNAKQMDTAIVDMIQQELSLLAKSYSQLNNSTGLAAVTARFYSEKLRLILDLKQQSARAYDRQYTACLADLDNRGSKTELSTMLCEVQANAAGRQPQLQLNANLIAFNQQSKHLKTARQNDSSISTEQLESQYLNVVEQQLADNAH
ncbi:MAG: hypothetical protein V7707_10480 [Motiliproteus sp.]